MTSGTVSKPSGKAVFWLLFAAGGTVCSFILPVLILITGIAAGLGLFQGVDGSLTYPTMHAFVGFWLVKLALFGIIFLGLWHAAHRLRVCAHDFGIRADMPVALVLYGLAAAGTLATLIALLRI